MRTLIALLLILAPGPAAAQASSCRIRISGLEFGTYRSLDPAPETSIGRLDVDCVPVLGTFTPPRVTLGTGNSGNYSQRTMTLGTYELRYNLFAEPARRRILGDGSAGSTDLPPPRTRAVGRAVWPIFGAIPPGQRVPAGTYTDTILIQVEF